MINNTNDLNKYYTLVNQYIDEYLDKGIKASKLNKYLNKSRLQNFLERKGLMDIQKIDQVVKDVLNDRVSIEKDTIMKFESFKLFESNGIQFDSVKECLYKNVGGSTISHEKILADFYDVSLSQIDIVRKTEEHCFRVDKIGGEVNCIIYTKDDLEIISENFKELIINKLPEKNIELEYKLNIPVKEFIDYDKLKKYLDLYLNGDQTKIIISQVLQCEMEHTKSEFPHFIGLI
jgi:hypothetical protein